MMMASSNLQAGGPVGGGMVMMNNGGAGTPSSSASQDSMRMNLNTYIYEYILKLENWDLAREMHKSDKFEFHIDNNIKHSPGRKSGGVVNGDAMDMDGNSDHPPDLPRPGLQSDALGMGFLFDWFCLFNDMFQAQRQKSNDPGMARQYITQTQNQQRQRENIQNAKLPGNGMMASNPQQMAAAMRTQMMRNNMMNGGGNKMAQSLTPAQLAQMKILQQQQQQQQAAQHQQMQRDGSDMGINGQRPATPPEGEHGGSPSKRPRIDGQQQFNGGMVPNGRGQAIANQGMLMQSGFNPAQMNQAPFRQNGALQQKPMMQGPVANGMNMGMNTESPMMGNIDPQFSINGMEAMNYGRMPGQAGMQNGPAAQSGNHALQDYQMQLMLLEQQNKKRLMMARQEQDSISRGDGGAHLPGQVGMQQGMSPSGSRTGTSPIPMDQMKRGTSQMGMGSPSGGDIQGRGSPPPIHFMQGQGPDFNSSLFMNSKEGLVPGGPNMRQQNMDINALRAAQQGRVAGQFPPGQPMAQNPSQGQPHPMGTPGMRNEMPPPSAPAAGGSAQRGGQPASPNSSGAPPTPSLANKTNPKGKKAKEGENARKRPNKKNSTANADAAEPPATPTPSTPITPVHPASFNGSGGKGPNAAANPAPTSNPTSQPVQQMPPTDQTSNFDNFGDSQAFNLDFSTLENPDVLENFDFDSFLNQSGTDDLGAENFGAGFDFDMNGITDGS